MTMSPANQLILSGTKLFPSEEDLIVIEQCISEVGDWDSFIDLAIRNSVAPLLFKNLSLATCLDKVPEKVLSRLKQAYYKVLVRNVFLIDKFRIIVNTFNENKIDVIPLKGIFLSDAVYKDIGLRPMSDIDLLVKKEDADKCLNILLNLGYQNTENYKSNFIKKHYDSQHLAPLVLNGVSVEIHTKVLPDNYQFKVNLENYWKNANHKIIHGSSALELSANDLLEHLCVHLDRHFNTGKIQLYSFCDIAEVIKQNKIDWTLFEKSCNEGKSTNNVFSILHLVNKYFGVTLPNSIVQKASLVSDPRLDELFFLYLNKQTGRIQSEINNANIDSLKKIHGFRNKIKYLRDDIFPSRAFMKKRYRIRHKPLIYWYYLVRIKTGVAGLLTYLYKNSRKP